MSVSPMYKPLGFVSFTSQTGVVLKVEADDAVFDSLMELRVLEL